LTKQQLLDEMLQIEDAIIWREGKAADHTPGYDRLSLSSALNLVIWTPPASYAVYRDAVRTVNPQCIYVIGDISGDLDKTDAFLRYLTGLVKFALKHEKPTRVAALAARMGHNLVTVQKGLAWLVARGYITFIQTDQYHISINRGDGVLHRERADYILDELKTLLIETAAYRRHFLRMQPAHMLDILKA
jgi:hypothetical protein